MDYDLALAQALCERFEGFRSKPYLCPAGVPTVGYGSTQYQNGTRVTLQDREITRAAALELLQHELRTRYLVGVLRQCPNLAKYPQRLNAVVDFAYNLGVGRLQTSTLKRKILAEDWPGAQEQLKLWTRGGGRVLPGLVLRRQCEANLL